MKRSPVRLLIVVVAVVVVLMLFASIALSGSMSVSEKLTAAAFVLAVGAVVGGAALFAEDE